MGYIANDYMCIILLEHLYVQVLLYYIDLNELLNNANVCLCYLENLNEICPQNNLIHLNVYVVIYVQIYRDIVLLVLNYICSYIYLN